MAKIFIQLRKNTAYLEEQAQTDSSFPWSDYGYIPPIVSSKGKKLVALSTASKRLEDWSLTGTMTHAALNQRNETLDQIAIIVGLLEHDNGNSSGIVDLPQETIDRVRAALEATELATFSQVTP
jgi:hypothetical protein